MTVIEQNHPVTHVSCARMSTRGLVAAGSAMSFLGWAPGPVGAAILGRTVVVTQAEVGGVTPRLETGSRLQLDGAAFNALGTSAGDLVVVMAVSADRKSPEFLVVASLKTTARHLVPWDAR